MFWAAKEAEEYRAAARKRKQEKRRGKRKKKPSRPVPATDPLVVPSGVHRGRHIKDLSDTEVHTLWASWNGFPRKRQTKFFDVLQMECAKRGKPPAREKMTEYKRRKSEKWQSDESQDRFMKTAGKRLPILSESRLNDLMEAVLKLPCVTHA